MHEIIVTEMDYSLKNGNCYVKYRNSSDNYRMEYGNSFEEIIAFLSKIYRVKEQINIRKKDKDMINIVTEEWEYCISYENAAGNMCDEYGESYEEIEYRLSKKYFLNYDNLD